MNQTIQCGACGCETPASLARCEICGTSIGGASVQACLLIYDIPERSNVPNPSDDLRPMAVRVNLSCWVIREGDIPYHLLNDMKAGGASWHVVKFDAGEAGKLAAMAIEALKRDTRDAIKRAREAQRKAEERLKSGENAESVARYVQRGREAVSRLRRLLADFRKAAERMGLDVGSLSLDTARTAVDALHSIYSNRARLYAEAATAAGSVDASDARAMGAAAKSDRVPAVILADYLDDNGGNGAPLRDAFTEE